MTKHTPSKDYESDLLTISHMDGYHAGYAAGRMAEAERVLVIPDKDDMMTPKHLSKVINVSPAMMYPLILALKLIRRFGGKS